MKNNEHNFVLYITMALYVISLLFPGLVSINSVGQTMYQYGYQILLIGWLGIFSGILSWYGYVLGIIGFLMLRIGKSGTAAAFSIFGLLLGLQAIYLQKLNPQVNFHGSYNSWENGMGELGVGYYLWIFAFCVLTTQCIIAFHKTKRKISTMETSPEITPTNTQ